MKKSTLSLSRVTKNTSFCEVTLMLNLIEHAARNFRLLSDRKIFIEGCLRACGFSFRENCAHMFSYRCHISADNSIYRLSYSCNVGKSGCSYCFDVDISQFQ